MVEKMGNFTILDDDWALIRIALTNAYCPEAYPRGFPTGMKERMKDLYHDLALHAP